MFFLSHAESVSLAKKKNKSIALNLTQIGQVSKYKQIDLQKNVKHLIFTVHMGVSPYSVVLVDQNLLSPSSRKDKNLVF